MNKISKNRSATTAAKAMAKNIKIKTNVSYNAEGTISRYGTHVLSIDEIAWLYEHGLSLVFYIDGKRTMFWSKKFTPYRKMVRSLPKSLHKRPTKVFGRKKIKR